MPPGIEPDCRNSTAISCRATPQMPRTPGNWNPLQNFVDVRHDHQLGNIAPTSEFLRRARTAGCRR